jgi:hypothetical protein
MARPKKEAKEGEVLQFSTTSLQVCDKLRTEHNIVPIAAVSNGKMQKKSYVYTESEEEINALLTPAEEVKE